MKCNEKNRKSNRLKNYDYSQNGMYFVTICVKDKEELLGEIKNGEMVLNESGKIAERCYLGIPMHFQNVYLDKFLIMPNHIHLIIEINVGVQFIEPKKPSGFDESNPYTKQIKNNPMILNRTTLGKIIRYYKAKTANEIRKKIKFWNFSWQRSYYDHVIRNEISLNKIREYIINNPKMWDRDKNSIENIWM